MNLYLVVGHGPGGTVACLERTMGKKPGKTAHIFKILRSRLAAGRYKDRLPSDRALAEELGVTLKTVQLALAQLEILGQVRRESRQGTYPTVSDGPNISGMELYVRIVSEMDNPSPSRTSFWGAPVVMSFEHAARRHGLRVEIEYSFREETNGAVERTLSLGKNPLCVGTCLFGCPINIGMALKLSQSSSPVVVADRELDEVLLPNVVFDNLRAGQLAALHLLELGHQRIALVSLSSALLQESTPSWERRARGVRDTLAKAGVSLTHEVYAEESQDPQERLLSLYREEKRATALICSSASSAAIAYEVARQVGFDVPGDMSLMSFGQPGPTRPRAGLTSLTYIGVNCEAMGWRSLEVLLDEQITAHPRKEYVDVWLNKGETTGPLHGVHG